MPGILALVGLLGVCNVARKTLFIKCILSECFSYFFQSRFCEVLSCFLKQGSLLDSICMSSRFDLFYHGVLRY